MKQLHLPIEFEDGLSSSKKEEAQEVEVVSVILCRHKVVNVIGAFTGRTYKFGGAGSIVDDVDIRDAEALVNKPLPPSCCGSFPTPQFQILGR